MNDAVARILDGRFAAASRSGSRRSAGPKTNAPTRAKCWTTAANESVAPTVCVATAFPAARASRRLRRRATPPLSGSEWRRARNTAVVGPSRGSLGEARDVRRPVVGPPPFAYALGLRAWQNLAAQQLCADAADRPHSSMKG